MTEKEILEIPITVHGKIQRYQVNVEARFDEDEDAIEILTETAPSSAQGKQMEAKQPKKWGQFWK